MSASRYFRTLALAVPCPRCKADVGDRCYAPRIDNDPHTARQDRAIAALGGPWVAGKAACIIADAVNGDTK